MSQPESRSARSERRRRTQIRRRRATVGLLAAVLVVAALVITLSSNGSPPKVQGTAATGGGVPSIEAGIESWQLAAPISREVVAADGGRLQLLGGLSSSGNSLSSVFTLDPTTGTLTQAGSLPDVVHDAAGAMIGRAAFSFGGGSPTTFANVQAITLAGGTPTTLRTGASVSQLPQPRSDLAVASLGRTTYLVGGYDGTTYLPSVLATVDGRHFSTVANLKVPVRYAAVASLGQSLYAFGGQTGPGPGTTATTTAAIEQIDPSTYSAQIVGHLPQALYGAAAYVLGGHLYVAGGQTGDEQTHRVHDAGLLPQAVAFAGAATTGAGQSAVGYLVGGEVTHQSGSLQAGVASGSLQTVISLRPSRYGGPVGGAASGSPYQGHLLIADRGNDRLMVLNPAREMLWVYPSATRPPPPGGFYFPDDAFFFHKGTGIISNQEENHTIVQIAYPSGKIVWQYGHPGKPGSAPGYLNQPDDAYLLKNGEITVADAMNDRILFLSQSGTILGQIGTNGVAVHNPPTGIAYPNGDTPLGNGDVLVSEINGSWVSEYTPTGHIVWTVHLPTVNYPSDPQQLGPDLYLLADYNPPGEGRILTIHRTGAILWTYDALAGDAMLKKPSLAERLPNGLFMVNDDYRDRVVAIDPKYNTIVWQYGITDVSGTAPGLLTIPDGFDLLLANGTTPTHLQTG
jgi:hypothetical protein